jgi:hypothetical protein
VSADSLAVRPAHLHVPPYIQTDGPDVAALCELAGYAPDPDQRLVLDAIFAHQNSRSVAFEIAVIACRQNLKTAIFKQAALGWLFVTGERLIVWSAHEFRTAQEAFRDLEELIASTPLLRREVKNIYRGNGDEAIELKAGPRIIFKTRTKGGGRGLSGRKVILDEGFALRPMHMGALLPTLSAQPDPQVLYGSSAGLAESDVMRGVRDRGHAGGDPRLAYFEWCSPPPEQVCRAGESCTHALGTAGCGCDDPANWHAANPALGRRITVDYVAAERRALPPAEFGRERMGWWDEPEDQRQIISLAVWDALADPRSEPRAASALSVVFSADRSRAAVGLAGQRPDGCWHVEVADYQPGTDWVPERVTGMWERHQPGELVIDPGGHENSVIPVLETAGITVTKPTARDIAAAYGIFYDAALTGTLRHRGQGDLTVALMGATVRNIGDGGTAWGRRKSGVDISPLVAVTQALWAAVRLAGDGDYTIGESVGYDAAEVARLLRAGVYSQGDVERLAAAGIITAADAAQLAKESV